jgi:hypothetical protein
MTREQLFSAARLPRLLTQCAYEAYRHLDSRSQFFSLRPNVFKGSLTKPLTTAAPVR